MSDVYDDFSRLVDRFGAVVTGATTGWDAPSPCEEWTAAGVVDHVVDTQRDFLVRQGLDPGDRPVGDPDVTWHGHRAGVRAALGDGSVLEREFDGYFGRTTVGATLARFYGFDLIVHRWDLGRALGVDVRFDDEEMDRVETAIAGFGDALYSAGVCGPPVAVPEHASRQDRLLGRLGRDPSVR